MSNIENKTKPYFIPILRLFDLIPNDVWKKNPHKKEYVEKLIKCLESQLHPPEGGCLTLPR